MEWCRSVLRIDQRVLRKDWSVFLFPFWRSICSCVVPFQMVTNVLFQWILDFKSVFCDMCDEVLFLVVLFVVIVCVERLLLFSSSAFMRTLSFVVLRMRRGILVVLPHAHGSSHRYL